MSFENTINNSYNIKHGWIIKGIFMKLVCSCSFGEIVLIVRGVQIHAAVGGNQTLTIPVR